MYLFQTGNDSGRHQWYRFAAGPLPESDKTTQVLGITVQT